jgi:hypothetical protein
MPTDSLAQPAAAPAAFSISRRIACIALSAILVVLLFWLGSMPFAAGLFPDRWDKVAHCLFFGLLAGLLHAGFGGRRALLAVALVMLVGALDELHQGTLPGRSEDIFDWLADAIAASVVVTGLVWWRGGAK